MSPYFLTTFHALLLFMLRTTAFTKSVEAKCIERERLALLNFKHSLADYGMLSTWSDDDNNTDCCNWNGIQCNNLTGHVQVLDLRGDQDYTQCLTGAIDLTSLIHLQNLQHLDLSYNFFFDSHITQLIGSFTNLTYLNLSYSYFSGRIPYELGKLTQLQYLDLGGYNYFWGAIPLQIGNLRHLQYLDLGGSFLSRVIPCQIRNLRELQYLKIGSYIPASRNTLQRKTFNTLYGAIPFQMGNLPNLHTLRLVGNFYIKDEDAEWFSNLSSLTNLELSSLHNLSSSNKWLQTISKLIPKLKELRLVDCSLLDSHIQSLFHSHSNFSNHLTILDLSYNMLTSSSLHFFVNFSLHLQELYLSHNDIVFSSPPYPNFPSLSILDLSFNNLTSSIFQGFLNFGPKLQDLVLRSCSLVDTSFLVSSSTSNMNFSSSVIHLDLSYNLLKSSAIFHSLFNFTTNLHSLWLQHNFLEGHIADGFGEAMTSLEILDLSNNKLQGKIQSFFGNMCRLQSLNLSNNELNGDISYFIQNFSWCNRHILQALDLSYNQITGKIPKSIRLLSELKVLFLEGNSLEGEVTESHLSNLSNLVDLSLSYDSLSLKFVSSWLPPFRLLYLGLASCKLGPSFPSWLKTQSSLMILDISDNRLNDSVPEWFWNNLEFIIRLNMSHNDLDGAIPDIPLNLPRRPSIILNSNQFQDRVPTFLFQATELLLSENKFSDLFSFLCNQSTAASLATLDLSSNQIKGQLPDCWKSTDRLLFLDLSNNKLSALVEKEPTTTDFL